MNECENCGAPCCGQYCGPACEWVAELAFDAPVAEPLPPSDAAVCPF